MDETVKIKPIDLHLYVAENGGVTLSASAASARPIAAFGDMEEATTWLLALVRNAQDAGRRGAGTGAARSPVTAVADLMDGKASVNEVRGDAQKALDELPPPGFKPPQVPHGRPAVRPPLHNPDAHRQD